MRVEQHLDEVARTQGWSDKAQLIHALTFLDRMIMQGVIPEEDFRAYLEHQGGGERGVAPRRGQRHLSGGHGGLTEPADGAGV